MAVFIDRKDSELLVKFDYNPGRIAKIKCFKGYLWNTKNKLWSIPYSQENLKDLFQNERCTIAFEDNTEIKSLYTTMKDELKLKGYSHKTQKSYLNHVKLFSSFIDKHLKYVQLKDIRDYLLHLLENHQASHSYVSQAISAIKFFIAKYSKQIWLLIYQGQKRKRNLLIY